MIVLESYDSRWPELAADAITAARAATGGSITAAEHVGSTSVPGLLAKPIIDLMAATPALDDLRAHEPALAELGYHLVETGMPERLLYRRTVDKLGYHLHVVTQESWPTRNERILRDHLRETPADRDRYARLKEELAVGTVDVDAYTRGKTALVQEMIDVARRRRGLPWVNVWE